MFERMLKDLGLSCKDALDLNKWKVKWAAG